MPQGGNKTFSCPVDGNPQPNITWYRGSEVSETPIFSGEKLEARESGCYTCVASNSVGKSVIITQCLEMVIKLCLFKIHLFFNEKSLCHFLVPVFSYDLCSVKMTLKKNLHPSTALYRSTP